jgi:hypothetical protein
MVTSCGVFPVVVAFVAGDARQISHRDVLAAIVNHVVAIREPKNCPALNTLTVLVDSIEHELQPPIAEPRQHGILVELKAIAVALLSYHGNGAPRVARHLRLRKDEEGAGRLPRVGGGFHFFVARLCRSDERDICDTRAVTEEPTRLNGYTATYLSSHPPRSSRHRLIRRRAEGMRSPHQLLCGCDLSPNTGRDRQVIEASCRPQPDHRKS